jgi:predicted transcriptional regulator
MADNAAKGQISVPLDSELLARVKSAAEQDHRSVAAFARIALAKVLAEQQGDGGREVVA